MKQFQHHQTQSKHVSITLKFELVVTEFLVVWRRQNTTMMNITRYGATCSQTDLHQGVHFVWKKSFSNRKAMNHNHRCRVCIYYALSNAPFSALTDQNARNATSCSRRSFPTGNACWVIVFGLARNMKGALWSASIDAHYLVSYSRGPGSFGTQKIRLMKWKPGISFLDWDGLQNICHDVRWPNEVVKNCFTSHAVLSSVQWWPWLWIFQAFADTEVWVSQTTMLPRIRRTYALHPTTCFKYSSICENSCWTTKFSLDRTLFDLVGMNIYWPLRCKLCLKICRFECTDLVAAKWVLTCRRRSLLRQWNKVKSTT